MLGLAIQRGLVQSRLGWLWIDDRIAAERVARSLLAQPVSLTQAREGGWTGTADGRRFAVRLSPVNLPLPEPEPAARPGAQAPAPAPPIRWVPLRLRIEVATARGSLSLETIRLCPFE
ncbi:conserved hypothetical protein [Methylobacterium nodulans ORS 2060]|uniref:General secretion pathway protein I n=2 Tax=Methylobacterium nodulans TaxID=114616 RepID=B8IR83_METNO|nr:hypothetical protein [Methylobacterium nodulans]ACL56785.1 conserved hypothetical protein [Methylobacterium nodulans ORS 2060]